MGSSNTVCVVVTGAIGSGKSALGSALAARGAMTIDADAVGHAVLDPGGEAFGPVARRWPEVVVEGRIDRRRLADIVFTDPGQLAELEAMTHPAISRRIAELVEAAEAELVVVEIPLVRGVVGEQWPRVVVDAPVEERRRRLEGKGLEADDIEHRMAAQPSREEWRAAADYLVDNSGTLEDLEEQADRLMEWLAHRTP